jgi:hypothetical protein
VLLDLAFPTELSAKPNELNSELEGKNKTIIKMIDSIDSLKRTEVSEDSPDQMGANSLPKVESRADGSRDVSTFCVFISYEKFLKI